jgi:hypothetical protein
MESVLLPETQMNYYQAIRSYILKDSDFHILIDIYLFIIFDLMAALWVLHRSQYEVVGIKFHLL